MPEIHAASGDAIAVSITLPSGSSGTVSARIMTKGNDGKWEIELAGDPPLRGKIDIAQYEWSQEAWRKRTDQDALAPGIASLKSIRQQQLETVAFT